MTIGSALTAIESEVLSWQDYWLKQEKRLYALELLATESSSYRKESDERLNSWILQFSKNLSQAQNEVRFWRNAAIAGIATAALLGAYEVIRPK